MECLILTLVTQLLDDINTNKAPGPDGIHGCFLKHCSKSLCRPLSIIFKLSYNTGIIPSEWKSANIVPVHKKGDKNLVNNYPPISLISLTAKIMECIIQEELLIKTRDLINPEQRADEDNDDVIESYSLYYIFSVFPSFVYYYPEQHVFLSGKSCNTNLLTITDSIVSSLYDDIGIDIIYFDFAKTFDTVNHNLLLQKLKSYYKIGARLLKFLINYLQNRVF